MHVAGQEAALSLDRLDSVCDSRRRSATAKCRLARGSKRSLAGEFQLQRRRRRGLHRTGASKLSRWEPATVCPSTAPPEATSLPSEAGPVPLPPTAGRRSSSSSTTGSPAAPIGFRLGRGRLGSKSLDFFRTPRQIGIGGTEVGCIRLCVVVAVCQRWSHCEPAWNRGRKDDPFFPCSYCSWERISSPQCILQDVPSLPHTDLSIERTALSHGHFSNKK